MNFYSHVASHLPLPADIQGKRPRIDFVVFMIDLTNRERSEMFKFFNLEFLKSHIEYIIYILIIIVSVDFVALIH